MALHQPPEDRLGRATGANRTAAIVQVALLALCTVHPLLLNSARPPAPPAITFDILMLCGFALQNVFWAYRSMPARTLSAAAVEIAKRWIQVAGLTLLSAMIVLDVTDASWQTLQPERAFVLVGGIVLGGVAFLAFCRKAATPARRLMVIGNDDAFEFARRLRLDRATTKVIFVPLQELLSRAAGRRDMESGFCTVPRIVEHDPDVAILFCSAEEALKKVTSLLAPLPIDVLLHTDGLSAMTTGVVVTLAQRTFVRIFPKPLNAKQRFMKRAFDIMGSVALLLLTFPILVLSAIGVAASSPGPILFKQPRIGLRGRPFTIFKLRTMQNAACDLRADMPTMANDPRVTWFGSLLRKTSIDELPQLLNVLLGDMSLIGPRPHAMNGEAFSAVVPNYQARHRVKPGITGLAQVLGWRGPANTSDKIEQRTANDLRYINEWSINSDVMILVRTIFAMCGKNAF